jgi:hypothetical protein
MTDWPWCSPRSAPRAKAEPQQRAPADLVGLRRPAAQQPGQLLVVLTVRLPATLPGEQPVVVFTASLLSYLGADARAAFAGQLDEAARQRPVAWVFAEAPGLLAAAGVSAPALAQRNGRYLAGVSLRGHGQAETRLLALADPYVRWLALAREPGDDFQWLPDEA